jgi:hypothetical protein
MDPIILFFLFGLIAGLLKCQISFSSSTSELITTILLIAIGLKGGIELHDQNLIEILPKIFFVTLLGLLITVIAFSVLYKLGRLSRVDAASLAAHYGSVSVGTFAVCIAFLKSQDVSFEPYVPLFVITLEIPAIIIGLVIAKQGSSKPVGLGKLFEETFKSRAITLLLGGFFIGWLAGATKLDPYAALFINLFYGVLALFLIEMGRTVSEQLAAVKKHGAFMLAFGLCMPIISGGLALSLAMLMDLSMGGAVVLAVLGASSSYIAVPAAMKISLPEANLSLSLGSSLGITFPFNVIFGIPIFYQAAKFFYL